ncbi:lysostaphin resistance A-like protein [Streptomyces sp. NPDC053048]|uniref:lysostaphin resistance A-like protein n=1 Tax=Streptomyces sp. NPDC053048 TaxID=3365694 RepID=UPI0037CD0EA9
MAKNHHDPITVIPDRERRKREASPDRHRVLPKTSVFVAGAVLFVAVTFVGAGALGAVQPATGIPGEVVQLTQFGPALGVAAVALFRPASVRSLLAGAFRSSHGGGGRGSGLPLLATALLIITCCVTASGIATGDVRFTPPSELHHPFALIVVAQLIGACGEEIGWRCFLQPLLRTRFGPLTSSIVVGVLWGVWHVQVFAQNPAYAGGFLLGAVSMSVVMGTALERLRSSRLLWAGGFHTLINLGMLLFMDEESGAVLPMVLFGVSCLPAALFWGRRAPSRIDVILDSK